MPRPCKKRNVCGLPNYNTFMAEDGSKQAIYLTLDEYETIRLIDLVGMKQEDCAKQMQISRTSVTAIYESARKKLAEVLVTGKMLYITGGNIQITYDTNEKQYQKGEKQMRIAITYENGEVFQHFGKTPAFKLYDIEDNTIVDSRVMEMNSFGHSALAGFLAMAEVDLLICGGMGMGAQYALQDAGIQICTGVSGNCDEVVNALINGTLEFVTQATCDHHHEEGHECCCGHHHEEEHECCCGHDEEEHECCCGDDAGCCCHES